MCNKINHLNAIYSSQAVKSNLSYLQQDLAHFSQLSTFISTRGTDILPTSFHKWFHYG